jgi:hypothetical protein
MQAAGRIAKQSPRAQFVSVVDSESDIYEVIAEGCEHQFTGRTIIAEHT